MTVARRKGNPGKADMLFSRIVRSRGRCEYPGCDSPGPYDTAHIIGRRYSATRCDEANAICACRTHHQLIDTWDGEKRLLVGDEMYDALRLKAEAGIDGSSSNFWAAEVERLTERCRELGIDHRWRAA